MAEENIVKVQKISLKATLSNFDEDVLARLRIMKRAPSFSNKFLSILSPNLMAVLLYRLAHYCYSHRWSLIAKFFYAMNISLYGCDITPPTVIGPGFYMDHVVATAIHAKIGKNAILYGQVVLGGRGDRESSEGWMGGPVIGDQVTFGFGAKVFGPVTIGDRVFIGAMSVITQSLPDDASVITAPPRMVRNIKKPFTENPHEPV